MKIRYFTAMVNGAHKPNQETYIKALSTTSLVEVVLGRFKKKTVKCAVTTCAHAGRRFFEMYEEKHTDVNLAICMLDDAFRDECDNLILVSGDSDRTLYPPCE